MNVLIEFWGLQVRLYPAKQSTSPVVKYFFFFNSTVRTLFHPVDACKACERVQKNIRPALMVMF